MGNTEFLAPASLTYCHAYNEANQSEDHQQERNDREFVPAHELTHALHSSLGPCLQRLFIEIGPYITREGGNG